MAGFFTKNNAALSPRALAEQKYNGGRHNLMLMLIFTVINSILVFTGSLTYFVFSASVPYYCTLMGSLWGGKLPEEYYVDVGIDVAELAEFGGGLMGIYLAVAAIIVVLYVVCFFASSKNRYGWLIAAIVLFVLDTVFMVTYYGISVDMILDVVFHVWVLYYLVVGSYNGIKLKRMPVEEAAVAPEVTPVAVAAAEDVAAEAAFAEPAAETAASAENDPTQI